MPKYTFAFSLTDNREVITRTMDLWEQGILQPVTHPPHPDEKPGEASAFPFTTEGVRRAWTITESHHAHGKVVIDVTKASN
jgi:NADPH-dependent ferric siderophore reductase